MNCRDACLEVLGKQKVSREELAKLTGFARTSVETAVRNLMAEKHPLTANVRTVRSPNGIRLDGRQSQHIKAKKPEEQGAGTVEIVPAGIAKRSLLERAWAGEQV